MIKIYYEAIFYWMILIGDIEVIMVISCILAKISQREADGPWHMNHEWLTHLDLHYLEWQATFIIYIHILHNAQPPSLSTAKRRPAWARSSAAFCPRRTLDIGFPAYPLSNPMNYIYMYTMCICIYIYIYICIYIYLCTHIHTYLWYIYIYAYI